jgi:DNA-binding NarL/FixJ family response regulator
MPAPNLPSNVPLDLGMGAPLLGKVLLVEDDVDTRLRFEGLVRSLPNLELVQALGSATEAITWLANNQPDVLLCDLGLPDFNGIKVIEQCALMWPNCEIMVISVFGDEDHVIGSIQAGATGYVLKDVSAEQLAVHIQILRAGGSPISPGIARKLLNRFKPQSIEPVASPPQAMATPTTRANLLSTRELEVLNHVAKGFSSIEIAQLMGLSTHTVMAYVKRVYKKLAVHSRGEAVYEARQMGILK